MTRSLHLVDVFTDRPCSGNQLAVVTGAKGLHAPQMIDRHGAFAQRLGKNIGRRHGVLHGEIDPDAADWRHRMRGPTQSRRLSSSTTDSGGKPVAPFAKLDDQFDPQESCREVGIARLG